MREETGFTQGKILKPLMAFALPVLFALFLQAMYGAADLLVAGKFAAPEDVSAVSTGSQIMLTLGNLVSSLAMGTTVYFGHQIGMGNARRGGEIIGASVALFLTIGAVMSLSVPFFAAGIARAMNAPDDAFPRTVLYIQICGGGMIAIVAYNLIGSVFRGMGDSATPLLTVGIACVCNIIGDFILIAFFHLGAAGAAVATVAAQFISVLCSLIMISHRPYPFAFRRSMIRFMVQGIAGAFLVRIPVCLFMSRWEPVTLFHIGLSTPCSTVAQIAFCVLWIFWLRARTPFLTPEE